MKIILLILLTSCTLLNAEYKRHKIRGPPYPPRIPPSRQFAKKWHQQPQHPPRGPVRSRPIPVYMPAPHKMPMGMPQVPQRNTAIPETYISAPQKEKPFLAAPSIQEYDYQIQTNNIPTTHNNPIKQVGEKGPIHTIPAPNLSLKDKPIVVEEFRKPMQEIKYQYSLPHVQVQQSHQYQVTELPEHSTKLNLYRAQPPTAQQQQIHQLQIQFQDPSFQQELQKQQLHQQHLQQHIQEPLFQQDLQKQVEIQPQQLYYTTDAVAMPFPTQKNTQGDIYLNSQLNPKQLYQLISAAYPQEGAITQGQPQEIPKSFLQQTPQVPNYDALLTQQLFQAEPNYVKTSDHQQAASEKINFQPEYHSFNYDEQAHRKSHQGLTKEQLSSLVTAAYNLDGRVQPDTISARNSLDPVTQAQLVQNYFDTRSDVVENDVEPDAKPSSKDNQPGSLKDKFLGSSYFSSLPNKEAAERLAELQVAGKINSNLMKISSEDLQANESVGVLNYEDSGNKNGEHLDETSKDQPVEYEDYSQEEPESESEEHSEGFGHRLQSNN